MRRKPYNGCRGDGGCWWPRTENPPSTRSLATKNDEKSAAHTNGWRLADKAQTIFVRVIRRGVFHAGNVNVALLLHRSLILETTFSLTGNKLELAFSDLEEITSALMRLQCAQKLKHPFFHTYFSFLYEQKFRFSTYPFVFLFLPEISPSLMHDTTS
jgi:hypothetical protein